MNISRAIFTVFACILLIGSIGTSIGYCFGKFAPGYYAFTLPGRPQTPSDAVSIGVGRGVTQGVVGGAVVGLALVAIFARQQAHTTPSQPNADVASSVRAGTESRLAGIIAISLFLVCIFSICAGFLGLLAGTQQAYRRQYALEQQAMAPILASDPAYAGIEIQEYSGGGIWLSGEIASEKDFARLKEQFERTVGSVRARSMFCVNLKRN